MELMRTYLWIIVIFLTADILITPFLFGQERKPFNPGSWLINSIFVLPLLYFLYKYLTL